MKNTNFISLADYSFEELYLILNYTKELKARPVNGFLQGKNIAMIFEKNSTRTRVSFEVGVNQMGGDAIVLNSSNMQLGKGETIHDTAKVLERYVDLIMIRANHHYDIEEFAKHANIPIINGLSDYNHPCQVMADIFTYIEKKGDITGKTVCWVGDGNNVCNSWLNAANILKFKLQLALKPRYYPDEKLIHILKKQNLVEIFDTPNAAAKGADLVTTDTWVSMGDSDVEQRLDDFKNFQITAKTMSVAADDAIFMHCLPAYRGKEVAEEVIDGMQSVIFDEAENRLHVQKAIMCYLLGII